jgi:hypothetical protein
MLAIISLLLVMTLSLLVTRVATVALAHTGLAIESARFQARSAFTGCGFTTTESEKVVNHPVRRRILMTLMLLGNAGIITAASSLILGFVSAQTAGSLALRMALLFAGAALLWGLSMSRWVDRRLSRFISRMLRRYTRLEVRDFASLLHLGGDFRVSELRVDEEDWIAGKTLVESQLRDEGILVLGISRSDGVYLGAPDGETKILPGDVLVLYGQTPGFEDLDTRKRDRRGDRKHRRAVLLHQRRQREATGPVEPKKAEAERRG